LVGWLASGHITRDAAALDREHARDVQEGLCGLRIAGRPSSLGDAVLPVQAEGRSRTACGWRVLDEAGQRDGRAHVGQRIVRRSCSRPFARARCSSLKLGAVFRVFGHSMPSGRSA
jgi:hypothetical protein